MLAARAHFYFTLTEAGTSAPANTSSGDLWASGRQGWGGPAAARSSLAPFPALLGEDERGYNYLVPRGALFCINT